MAGAQTATLQKIMNFRMESQQEHDELMQKRMRQRSSMRTQNLEPKPPDYVQRNSSKHRWYKEEEPGRVQQSFKQPATNTLSQPHPISCTLKSSNHSSYIQTVSKPQLFVFSGDGDYLEWERTMDKWLSYNRITKQDALAYAISQLKGKAYKWLLQEEDDRRYYKEPSIKTWESLKLVLRSKYASKGHTSLQSSKKKVTSAASFTRKKSETKMDDCEKESSSFDKEMLNLIKNYMELNKERKLVEKEEVSDCLPWLRDHGETNLLRNNECFLNSSHSDLLFKNTQACDELTCFEPVQPSSLVSVSQVAKQDSAESGLEQIVVFDPYGFQKTFLGTFLISPFIWNKTREMELSRHDLGMKHVVFEPGGKVSIHRNNNKLIEKEAATETFDFGDILASGERLLHVSAQQEFHHETNWIMSPALSWIQQTRQRSKWPPDHQDIASFAEHIGLDQFCEMLISDCAGRLQPYSWRPGAYVSKIIILGECSARARTSWDHKEFEADQNALLLNHIKIWEPPDMHQLQYYCRDYQIMMGDRGVTGEIGEVINGPGEELMSSSQIKEKPPDTISLQQFPKQCTHGNYLNSKKRMKPDLLAIGTGKNVLRSTLFEKRGNRYQSINDESFPKMELQQRNLESCLAASFDIGAVRGSYLINQKDLGHKTNCIRNLTHQAITSSWINVKSFSGERVMGSTTQVILSVPCLNFAEFRTSQTYLWRPGEYAKASDYVFKSSFIGYTDMMHLFLSKEPCADYEEAWKHTRRNSKCEEDKRFKPPDLDQDKHQDVTGFILIKEAPPDATFKPKPSRKGFGLMLLLYDKFLSANLFCVNEYESGLSNASGERRIKCISPFYITKRISNNAYHKGLQGKYKMISNFEVTNLVPCLADDPDLRTNLFEEGGDDMIMESSREWMQEPDYGELVAEDATRRIHWSRMEALSFLYFDLHSSYSTIKLIII